MYIYNGNAGFLSPRQIQINEHKMTQKLFIVVDFSMNLQPATYAPLNNEYRRRKKCFYRRAHLALVRSALTNLNAEWRTSSFSSRFRENHLADCCGPLAAYAQPEKSLPPFAWFTARPYYKLCGKFIGDAREKKPNRAARCYTCGFEETSLPVCDKFYMRAAKTLLTWLVARTLDSFFPFPHF